MRHITLRIPSGKFVSVRRVGFQRHACDITDLKRTRHHAAVLLNGTASLGRHPQRQRVHGFPVIDINRCRSSRRDRKGIAAVGRRIGSDTRIRERKLIKGIVAVLQGQIVRRNSADRRLRADARCQCVNRSGINSFTAISVNIASFYRDGTCCFLRRNSHSCISGCRSYREGRIIGSISTRNGIKTISCCICHLEGNALPCVHCESNCINSR